MSFGSGASAKVAIEFRSMNTGVFFEGYQCGARTGGYGTRDSQGPVVICGREHRQVYCRHNIQNETHYDRIDLGFMPNGQWHTFEWRGNWSHNEGVK